MPNVFNSNPGSDPNSGSTTGQISQNLLYGQDPREAMVNAILDMGGNPFVSSPIMKMLLSLAPGLQTVNYLTNIGAKPNDIQGMGGQGQMFGDFLKHSLGQGGGNIFGTLASTAANLPMYMNQLRDYQGQVKNGSIQNGDVSPFAASLEDQLSGPQGMGNLMTSLYAPSLGALARPWAGGLQDVLASKNRQMLTDYGNQPDKLAVPNFFDYVFGRG
jgi:hypothetical protein